MKTNKTIELTELYSAPKCKVVKTMVTRAILAVSNEPMDLEDGGELFDK